MRHSVQLVELGRVSYREGLTLQAKYLELAKASRDSDFPRNFLLALEHDPVYTVGIRSKQYSIEEESRLKGLGADFYRTSRGGLITFHGPGQLVMYPIVDLRRISDKKLGVRDFVHTLEQVIIDCASEHFRLSGVGRTENTGVWVNENRKLAAIGIAVSHGISHHGIAMNCDTDLSWFKHVIPCGIANAEATSLAQECNRQITTSEALLAMAETFSRNFNCHVT